MLTQEGHVELLETPLMAELLNVKWEKYAHAEFQVSLCSLNVH
jgi:hypothetical protein